MRYRSLAAVTLLAACALAGPAKPAAAQTCTGTGSPACLTGRISRDVVAIVGVFSTARQAIEAAILFERDLADVRFAGTSQLVFQSEFVRLCLEEELLALRAQTNATTGQPADVAQFCQDVALLRARLKTQRADGRFNNCFLRLTCGFTSAGTLQRCNEDVRNCITEILDDQLRCAAIQAGCTGVAP